MSLCGTGLVAIWHDLLPEAKPNFYEWHNREHMPERLGIPGFRRGRRYVALAGTPEYFNLYEADTVDILTGPDYLHRLNHPTPWTRTSVASFRNVARSLLAVQASYGVGQGGVMLTMRFDAVAGREAELRDRLRLETLVRVADLPGVCGAHFGIADEAGSNLETTERQARSSRTLVPRWVVLIEGVNRFYVEAARDRYLAASDLLHHGAAAPIETAVYVLEHARLKQASRA